MALYTFDGTWNDSRENMEVDKVGDTNVIRFYRRYKGENRHYVDGVGSRDGFFGKLIGGITGTGVDKRIDEQFRKLKELFNGGDYDIDIVGYSRGAAIARMFLQYVGRHFEQLKKDGEVLSDPPKVRFLGLFDTVASFGVPWNENEGEFVREIPDFVENTYHAMALDETRETFGIERCLGLRETITEVWFRGGHADIGGNATVMNSQGKMTNFGRSDIALNWMIHKAVACGLEFDGGDSVTNVEAPVTAEGKTPIDFGKAGTLSRRIHLGDLVHYSVEDSDMVKGINGRLLRRIGVPTRIEDEDTENEPHILNWVPPQGGEEMSLAQSPSLIELSSKRYPFDCPPARSWRAWLKRWKLSQDAVSEEKIDEYWSPVRADRALAWDFYVELQTRITTQDIGDNEGDDKTALESVAKLFDYLRKFSHRHGFDSANAATLIVRFLNEKVRGFTAKWHKRSLDENWGKEVENPSKIEFREELRKIQAELRTLALALSAIVGVEL